MWTTASQSTFEATIFLYGVLPVDTSIVNENLSCACTYVKGTLVGYTVRKITKAWTAQTHAARM